MNLEIHQKGQQDYLESVKERIDKKIKAIKKSELLSSRTKKVRVKTIKQAFLKEKKETNYNNF